MFGCCMNKILNELKSFERNFDRLEAMDCIWAADVCI